MPAPVVINNREYANSITDLRLGKGKYSGYIRRYKDRIEIYDSSEKPVACLNKYGVLLGFSKDRVTGEKHYKVIFRGDPIYQIIGKNILEDLKNITIRVKEDYIDTRKDGGMFSAFPNHEYAFVGGMA
jgi:hypothetical protein